MTPEQRTLSIWGGASAAGLLVVWLFPGFGLGDRAAELAQLQTRHHELHGKYTDLYPAEGTAADEVILKLKKLKDHQQLAVTQVERQLVPGLPREFLLPDLTGAQDIVRTEHDRVRNRAQSRKIALPATLPFGLLEQDPEKRTMQLAQLYLCRQVLYRCLAADFTRIASISPGSGWCDASGSYASLLVDFQMEGSPKAVSDLLLNLVSDHDKGVGLRAAAITANPDGSQRLAMTASLLTVNRAGWNLKEPPAPGNVNRKPDAPAGGGGGGGRRRGVGAGG